MGRGRKIFGLHCGKSPYYHDQPLKAILVKAQKRTEVEKACLPRENLSGHEQNVHGNMKSRGHSDELLEMRNMLLETEGKAIHVIK